MPAKRPNSAKLQFAFYRGGVNKPRMPIHEETSAQHSAGARHSDIPALTGFRFLAAFLVLLGHGRAVVRFEDADMIGVWLGPLAACGMTMFFVLSGFLMWLNYGEAYRDQAPLRVTRGFAIARFARLYPMLLCTLLVVCAVRWTSVVAGMPGALLYPLMMNAWLPGNGPLPITLTVPAAAHTWSISDEIFCYLLFPALALVFCRVRSRLAILAGSFLFVLILLLIAFLAPRHLAQLKLIFGTNMPDDQFGMWVTYYSPFTRIFEFGIGCLVGCYFTLKGRIAGGSSIPIILGLFALLVAIFVFANGDAFASAWAVHDLAIRAGLAIGSALLIYGMASRPDHRISRILASRPARIGGEISYSTYLLHPFVLVLLVHQTLARSTALSVCEWLLTMFVALVIIYSASYCTYRMVEVPARRWIKSLFTGQTHQAPQTLLVAEPRSSTS
jgi:peptidoglycan/LPS O-acetylase OafA/YrhL